MKRCLMCLEDVPRDAPGEMHTKYARRLFGSSRPPALEIDPHALHLFGLETAGRISISGIQKKLALEKTPATLRLATAKSGYILEPQSSDFPQLPENEHVTLAIAQAVGIPTGVSGLIRMSDGQLAFIVKRFDRTGDGRRLAMEDFCQLNALAPADKYRGSAELAAKTVKRFSDAPGFDLLQLFRLFLFSWWVGHGDLHLKNLALLSAERGRPRLSPAYDLLSTAILIPDDQHATPIDGQRKGLTPKNWRAFAAACELSEKVIAREAAQILDREDETVRLLERSPLRIDLRVAYRQHIAARRDVLQKLTAK